MSLCPVSPDTCSDERGYSLIELMIAVAILTVISGSMLDGVFSLTRVSGTVSNRTEMHSAVRNATELLQQEVGQAGRIALPAPVMMTTAVPAIGAATVTLTSVNELFVGELLVIDTGSNEETVTVLSINPLTQQINGSFVATHAANVPVQVWGGFRTGVVPPSATNGSTGTTLKIYGDINDTGTMVYIEYWCDTAGSNLYRRSTPFAAAAKVALTPDLALLNHITGNPDGSPCFTYQEETANGQAFVVNVAITLTVETAVKDPQTGVLQRETKALLNVAPRNVFNVWQLAGLGISNRVQPTPATVTALLP